MGGGSQTIATTETPLTSFRIQSSAYGQPVPLVYGRNRVTGNLLWYGDFRAIPHTTSSGASGGKGGGGITTENTSYTYQAAFLLSLCEGSIYSVNAYWVDKTFVNGASPFTVFPGSLTQTPWSYLSSAHPTEALGYRGVAYVSAAAYDLGNQASLGNHNFDITGLLPYNPGTIDGANPRAIIEDYLTHPLHGSGLPIEYVGDWTQFSSYCIASGLFMSPVYETKTEARQAVADLLQITNSGGFFSEGVFKIVPFGDTTITGNGITYTPNVTPDYALTDDDFLDETEPVRVLRTPNADAYNQVQIEYLDSASQYNTAVATAQDQASIELYGLRPMATVTAHQITDGAVARLVAQLILQRVLYTRNVYEFTIGIKYCRLEPCDYLTITDSRMGLNAVPVRVLSVEEDENGQLAIQAEDAPPGVLHSPLYGTPGNNGYTVNFGVDPGNVVAPAFFEVPATQAISGLAVGIAVTGNSVEWGGCEVWASNDGTNYAYVGKVVGGARYGTIASAITNAVGQTARVQLAGIGGQMLSGSAADADNLSTLCLVDDEYVAHTTSTLIAANTYDLTLAERGAYNTAPVSHSAGAEFIRVDDAIAYSDSLELDMVGKTLHFKFLSFNKFRGGKQQLADVTAYTYTVTGVMAKLPPPDLSGLNASASANSIFLDWTVPAGLNALRTEIVRSADAVLANATFLAAVTGPVGFYADYIGAGNQTFYYWLRTINAQGYPSAYIGPATATTGVISADVADGAVTHAKLAADAVWAGNIKAGEVQAGALAANAVVAGKIAANAITAAGGEIADLAVSTLKIQDQAVTVPTSSFTNLNGNLMAGTDFGASGSTVSGSRVVIGPMTLDLSSVPSSISPVPTMFHIGGRPYQGGTGTPTGAGFVAQLTQPLILAGGYMEFVLQVDEVDIATLSRVNGSTTAVTYVGLSSALAAATLSNGVHTVQVIARWANVVTNSSASTTLRVNYPGILAITAKR